MGNKHRRKTPQYYYNQQKQSAKRRKNSDGSIGIPWEFTFETWWEVWEKSGKWEQRGCRAGQYCMRRKNDAGPYSPDNVYIGEVIENNREGMLGWRARQREEKLRTEPITEPVMVRRKLEHVVPAKNPNIQKPIPKEIFSNERSSPWSWRQIMKAAFPTLTRVLKV
jgi:hypothetical protein